MLTTQGDDAADATPISTHSATLMAEPTAPPREGEHRHGGPGDFGAVSPSDTTPSHSRLSLGLLLRWKKISFTVSLTIVAASVFLAVGLRDRKDATIPTSPQPSKLERDPNPPVKPASFERHWPEIYASVKGYGEDKLWPDRVRRTTDQVFFVKFADGIYLPDGFTPEDPADLVDGWPRVIARSGIRFLRIKGDSEWVMGAWAAPNAIGRADAPAHPVVLSGYYIQETEVTNGQFEDYLTDSRSTRPTEWEQAYLGLRRTVGPDVARQHPAIFLSRKQALEFTGSLPGNQLPTEAQWEFAARSRGENRRYVWGDAPPPNRDLANVNPQDTKSTAPVGSYPKDRTLQGVVDMTGNVQEMCRDGWISVYQKSDRPVLDPCASPLDPAKPEYSIRGAGYDSLADDCATTRRDDKCSATEVYGNLGFRLVVECPDARKPR